MGTTMATKFVAWEVPTLDALKGSKVYILREKLNNGGRMNREEKDWLTEKVNSNTYFKSAVPLQGWRFDFSDILRTYPKKFIAPIKEERPSCIYARKVLNL